MDLTAIQEKLATFAAERNWDQFHSPKNLSMALAAEAAELLEIFQWMTEEQSRALPESAEETEMASQEIADVFIYLVRLADKLNIDIEKSVLDKISVNEKRYPVDISRNSSQKYSRRKK